MGRVDRRDFLKTLAFAAGMGAGARSRVDGGDAELAGGGGDGGSDPVSGAVDAASVISELYEEFFVGTLPGDLPEPRQLPAVAITEKGVYQYTQASGDWEWSRLLNGSATDPIPDQYVETLFATKLGQALDANGADITNAGNLATDAEIAEKADLDANDEILSSQIPDLAITETYTVADQTARLALDAGEGDVALQEDTSKAYLFTGGDPSVDGNWSELLYPDPPIDTVFGRTGDVQAQSGDYDLDQLGNVDVTALLEGVDADKPVAGTTGRRYWATDRKILYRDNGTSWEAIAGVGTSSNPLPEVFADTVDAGTVTTDQANIGSPSGGVSSVAGFGDAGDVHASDTITLADDASETLLALSNSSAVLVLASNVTDNNAAVFAVARNQVSILVNGQSAWDDADTDTKNCVFDAGTLELKNRTGGSKDYTVTMLSNSA